MKFNYLGAIDRIVQPFILRFAEESTGASVNPSEQRRYLLEINGWISHQQLHLSWTYSRNLHQCSTVEQLAQHCIESLRSLVQTAPSYASTDFPAARLNQKQLDQFMNKIQKSGRK